ncbi:hypothetical protein IG631_02597 [Alternaria alternata]|nr:hypothetical protein IG631_02597 [Alternaria alternata]
MEGDDIVFVENVSSTLDHSNHPKEGRVETCKPGEFTRHDRDVPVDAELPVRIDPGFSSLANDCPPLSSPEPPPPPPPPPPPGMPAFPSMIGMAPPASFPPPVSQTYSRDI